MVEIGRFTLFTYLFLATASHGVLDAMTDGGLGVAFFSPFDNRRYFLPWRPIVVSPISIARFFSGRVGVVDALFGQFLERDLRCSGHENSPYIATL
jgi:inner membrane protein